MSTKEIDMLVSRITLLYTCPDCGETSEQPLTNIVRDGTHVCDCGTDMELDDEVRVETT